jgi:hypothetical protein
MGPTCPLYVNCLPCVCVHVHRYGVIDGVSDPSMGWGAGGLFVRTFTTNVSGQ